MLDCIIIGAGPAGLAAGRSLVRSGLQIKILEAEAAPGGRTRSTQRDGMIVDLGAAFLASFYTRTLALAREAGVRVEPTGVRPGHGGSRQALLVDGTYRPNSFGTLSGFLRFPLVPASQKLRFAASLLRSNFKRGLDPADPGTLTATDIEDARQWALRTFSAEAYEFFVRLAFEPFFLYEAAEASAAFVQSLLSRTRGWHLLAPRNGMGDLSTVLAQGLPIKYGARASIVESDGCAFHVHHAGAVEHASTVIVAIPAPATRALVLPLESADETFVRSIRFVPSVRAQLGYGRRGVLYPPVIAPADPGRRPIVGIGALSAWFPQRADPSKDILQVNASAWRSAELLGQPADQVASQLLADCARLGVHIPAADWVDVLQEPHAIVHTPPGHFTKTHSFAARDRNGLYFAGDWLTGSTIEGAVRSGEAAAARARETLRGRKAATSAAQPSSREPTGRR